jgi:hypothetical protein
MQFNHRSAANLAHPTVALSAAEMVNLLDVKDREIDLRRQVAWFQRQVFGQKSERRLPEPEGVQGTLGELFEIVPDDLPPPNKKSRIAAHEREHKHKNLIDSGDESTPYFDDSKVPVEVITIPNPDIAELDPADYKVIGEKVSYRPAKRPGSYVVLKYVRPVIKLCATKELSCPPAAVGVINGCRADVSFIAGMIIDKFRTCQSTPITWNGPCASFQLAEESVFTWTELGSKHIGIVQSLLATCRLHDINPCDYFLNVLQRVGQHPASLVHQLTPRIWKQMFAANPLRPDLHNLCGRFTHAGE